MMTKLAKNNRFQTIKNIPNLAFNLNLLFNIYHSVFDLLAGTFSVKIKNADFLGEAMASYYIRLCYFKFVKIYSYISNSEIIKINEKVVRRLNEGKTLPRESAQLVVEVDPFGVLDSGPNQSYPRKIDRKGDQELTRNKHSFPILLSKIYLKIVLNIALNRNEAAKNIFYQFRIMEFFYKEIDLEFEINQIKERFHQVRNNAKERVSRATSPKKAFEQDSQDSDSQEVNIYKKGKFNKEEKVNKSEEIGFVPKLNFNNLSSGAPLKIGNLGTKEGSKEPVKHSNLDFVDRDRGALPAKISTLKLNLGKKGQQSKSKDVNQAGANQNKFSLDFTKLIPKVEKPAEDEAPQPNFPVPKIAPPVVGKLAIGDIAKPSLALNLGAKPAQPLGLMGMGKLNLANIERGTPVQIPSLPDFLDDKSSDSSVNIDFEEVEKARHVKTKKSSESNHRNKTQGDIIENSSVAGSQQLSKKDEELNPANMPLRLFCKLHTPQKSDQANSGSGLPSKDQKESQKSDRSDSGSSSSSVVGLMGPPIQSPGLMSLGIGKRRMISCSEPSRNPPDCRHESSQRRDKR